MEDEIRRNTTKDNVRKLLDDVKESNITLENHKPIYNKVVNSHDIIQSTLNGLKNDFLSLSKELREITETDKFKSHLQDNYVSRDVYEKMKTQERYMRDMLTWFMISDELTYILLNKMHNILDEIGAYEIKRDALREMKESERERNKQHKEMIQLVLDSNLDIVNNKFRLQDEKFILGYKEILNESNSQFNQMLSIIKDLLLSNGVKINAVNTPRKVHDGIKKELVSETKVKEEKVNEEVVRKPGRPKKDAKNDDIDNDFLDNSKIDDEETTDERGSFEGGFA